MKCKTTTVGSAKATDLAPVAKELGIKRVHLNLSKLFAKSGVNVDLKPDLTLEGKAKITKDGDKITLTYNPQKASEESIFHEYGHLYTELANDPAFIQKGVDQLRGTDLWERTAKLYPEYNDAKLGMEVLTTAIGIEAVKGYNSPLAFWLNRLFIRVSNALGINVDVAKQLASDMVSQNLTKKIDGRIAMEEQWQRSETYKKELKIANNFINDKLQPLRILNKNSLKTVNNQKFTATTTKLVNELTGYLEGNNRYADITQLKAISSITEYDIEWLKNVESRLDLLQYKYENTIELQSLTKEELAEFGKTIESIDNFLSTFVHIDNLDVFDAAKVKQLLDITTIGDNGALTEHYKVKAGLTGQDADVAETMAKLSNVRVGLAARVNTAKSKNKNLRVYFGAGVVAQSTNKETARDAMNIYRNRLKDENIGQRVFMNNLDSSNEFVANVGKINRMYQKQTAHTRARMIAEFEKQIEGISDAEIKQMYTDDEGNLGTFLIGKYDYIKFKEDLAKAQKGKDIDEKRFTLNKMTNSMTGAEIDALMEKKKLEIGTKITQEQYDRWETDNFRYDVRLKRYDTRLFGEYRLPKDDSKYVNQNYLAIQENEKLAKFHDYMVNLQKELVSHTTFTLQYRGALPIIDYMTSEQEDYDANISVDSEGNKLQHIRLRNIGEHISKRYINVPKFNEYTQTLEEYTKTTLDKVNMLHDKSFKTIDEITAFNDALKIENKELFNKAKSYDLKTIMPLFIESSLEHKVLSKIEGMNRTTSKSLKEIFVSETDEKGNVIKNNTKFNKDGTKADARLAGATSNVSKRFDIDMDMKLYGNFVKNNKHNKKLQKAKVITANIGLGFNAHAAAKNFSMGQAQLLLEAQKSIHFNKSDYLKAEKAYTAVLGKTFKDRNSELSDDPTVAIMKYFNVIDDYSELADKASNLSVVREEYDKFQTRKNKFKKAWNTGAFGLTTIAEHHLHNVPLLAMLESHRIIDGQIVSRWDYKTTNEQLDITRMADKDYVKQFIANSKANKNTIEEEFETKGIALADAYELVDNVMQLKKDENGKPLITADQESLFEIKVQGVNHKMHGIYNKEDKGIVENMMIGQMAMQFFHWLPAMWQDRYGTKGNPFSTETTYNERRQEYEIGNYNAIHKMVRKAIDPKIKAARDESGSLDIQDGIVATLSGILDFVANARVYYHTMTEYEKVNMMKALNEIGISLAATGMILGLSAAVPDDDKDSVVYNFVMYVLQGTRAELLGLTPGYGWYITGMNKVKNPAAVLTQVETATRGVLRMMGAATGTVPLRFKAGPNKGNIKFLDDAVKLMPGATQLRRWILSAEKGQNKVYSAVSL